MDTAHILTTLTLAFGLGMLHALDADHVMAVTGLASARADFKASARFCLRWALGHGLTLFAIAILVLLLGMAIPHHLSAWAESLVGVLLVAIGLWVLVNLRRQRAHVHFHRHDGLPPHAHWHKHSTAVAHETNTHQHHHGAVLVGVLHGAAGSAPLLALLPLAAMQDPRIGLLYVALFGIGVIVMMLLFGGLLNGLACRVQHWGDRFVIALRGTVALVSMAYGGFLLYAQS